MPGTNGQTYIRGGTVHIAVNGRRVTIMADGVSIEFSGYVFTTVPGATYAGVTAEYQAGAITFTAVDGGQVEHDALRGIIGGTVTVISPNGKVWTLTEAANVTKVAIDAKAASVPYRFEGGKLTESLAA